MTNIITTSIYRLVKEKAIWNKTKLNLIDQCQFCIHPVIAGGGLPLFENISKKISFKLIKTKAFSAGAVILYYERLQNWIYYF